jgi:hypothetical protein
MLTKTVLVALCGIGASVPALAQDETRIFQYSPIVRLVAEGQYRAEVWRLDNASGKEERAWSDPKLHGSSAEAMAAACATLRENYAYSCTQTSRDAKAGKVVKVPSTGVAEASGPPKEDGSKTPPANLPVPPPRADAPTSQPDSNNWAKELWLKAVAAASQPGSNWAKEFWTNQSRWSHGGGDGGGGGGGGGCQ